MSGASSSTRSSERSRRRLGLPSRLAPAALLLFLLSLLFLTSRLGGAEPAERAPGPGAPPHQVFRATSRGGLRYTWCVPASSPPKAPPPNLTVILHGTGLDYRWGHLNNKPGVFRPRDVVVSVDGTTPAQEGTRLFLGKPEDARAFRDFLLEMKQAFSIDRVFLYGHSQGGFFVVYFAGEFPDEVAGVVAHNSGAWNWSKTPEALKKVAIAFQHGTKDPVVPFPQSAGSRDFYVEKGFPLVRLRRIDNYNHWPNAQRSNESLGWCEGMTTPRPEQALALAQDLLRPKGLDEYQYRTAVDYSGARNILRRFEGKGPAPFKSAKADLVKRARQMIDLIEKEGKANAGAITKHLQKKKALSLDGGPWLGHLVALREDFRGVDSVETFLKAVSYDQLRETHAKAANKLLEAWYGQGSPAEKFQAVIANLPNAFLFEGYPPDLAERMEAWKKGAAGLGIGAKSLADYRVFELWKQGWEDGRTAYSKIWMAWKGP